jgi:hypothetical protein
VGAICGDVAALPAGTLQTVRSSPAGPMLLRRPRPPRRFNLPFRVSMSFVSSHSRASVALVALTSRPRAIMCILTITTVGTRERSETEGPRGVVDVKNRSASGQSRSTGSHTIFPPARSNRSRPVCLHTRRWGC